MGCFGGLDCTELGWNGLDWFHWTADDLKVELVGGIQTTFTAEHERAVDTIGYS